ncbi:dihydrofolate reductase [bacterium A37T11]|nr:dihydrofolate reductase [bacterium A37T11]
MSKLAIIVAAAENNAIGKNNELLWKLPDDLKFFKRMTTGHTVIMGRKTFESVGLPLPNRRNIIITRQPDFRASDTEVVNSLNQALDLCKDDDKEVFVVGGAEIYREALPLMDKLYITRVHASFDGDTYFPQIDLNEWRLTDEIIHPADERHCYAFSFLTYLRK